MSQAPQLQTQSPLTPITISSLTGGNSALLGDLSQDGSGDQDGDSVTNLYEYLAALDPTRVRTENLGLDDGDRDIDSDGLTVLEEQTAGTSPASIDTDDDGLSDAEEIFGVNDIYGVITTADPARRSPPIRLTH